MKIAIIGDSSRAEAWEKHLRKLAAIQEVVLTSYVRKKGDIDGAILLDSGAKELSELEGLIKLGINTYFISHIPNNAPALEKLYLLSREADVRVQFSHWPTLAPASIWMHQQMRKPTTVLIRKELQLYPNSTKQENIDHHWIDEVGWAIKWLGGNVHRIEAKQLSVDSIKVGVSITLRYEDSSIVSIQFSALGEKNLHHRTISDGLITIDCDAIHQKVRLYRENSYGNIKSEKRDFDPKVTAENSVLQFIKAIQLKKDTPFSAYDAYQTTLISDKIFKQLDK
ncbi:hypothetical protein [Rhodohalobacter halophilus]|uniref:hypothetical protein n=1 Tax=Rhodohalobacter halophilus TaxID=1812810 RepID=UPI00083F9C9C|nr:hypothetical protein [Rhodohalobacter halophilus]